MPEGIVRSGDFRNGTPVHPGHSFGNSVNSPNPSGNVNPQANATLDSNPVTWAPSPAHFGNQTGFSMQAEPSMVSSTSPGSVGSTIFVTLLGGFAGTVTLSYSGAPVGVTLAFGTDPTSTNSSVTVTVGAAVPLGKYTITITGTSGTEVENTNL